ncbi:MAG: hydratase [Rhodospirillaceae bacterium]|nr:hydratase [Rhodospirillaceae bacterium]
MTPEAAEQAAKIFLQCRDQGDKIDQLPNACRPVTSEDGYQIQNAFLKLDGAFAMGWKVAATNEKTQAMLGISKPFAGLLPNTALSLSPIDIPAGTFVNPALEGEFAVLLGSDLPKTTEPYDAESAMEAVVAVIPAIEIVDSRIGDRKAAGEKTLIAAGTVAGLVLGIPCTEWRNLTLSAHRVSLYIDNELKGEGDGSMVLGNPFNSLAWLANLCVDLGRPLTGGQIITLGTCTGLAPITLGSGSVVDFGLLGKIRLNFNR